MLTLIYVSLYWPALSLLCIAVLRWGGWVERTATLLLAVSAIGSYAFQSHGPSPYLNLEFGVFVVDLLYLTAILTLTIIARRWWLIWMTAFHVVAIIGHLAKLLTPEISRMAYGLMTSASAYPMLIALAIGIISSVRSKRSAQRELHS